MSQDKAKDEAREMLLQGKPDAEILSTTGLDPGKLGKIKGWLNGPTGKAWQESRRKAAAAILPEAKSEEELVEEVGLLEDGEVPEVTTDVPAPKTVGLPPRRPLVTGLHPGNGRAPEFLDEPTQAAFATSVQQQLIVVGTPIVRKIVLDPMVYFWHDYFTKTKGYTGDVGDFMKDCLADFLESRGFSLVVEQKAQTQVFAR